MNGAFKLNGRPVSWNCEPGETLRDALRRVPDIDRALSRLALDRDGPRDMTAIRAGLDQAGRSAGMLAGAPPSAPAMARAARSGPSSRRASASRSATRARPRQNTGRAAPSSRS